MRTRLSIVLFAALAIGCGGTDTPTGPTPPVVPGAPTISCPANVTAGTTGSNTAVAFPAPTLSGGVAPVTLSCSPTSGSVFNLGATVVACTATDALSRSATCGFSVTVSRIPTLQRTRFLAFGDSLTAGEITVPTTTALDAEGFPSLKHILVPAASYPTQLQTLLRNRYITQQTAIVVTNAGLPGEAAQDGQFRFPGVLAAVSPEVVLLFEGANDLALDGAVGVTRAANGIERMARDARARGARVFIASLTPPRGGGRNSLPPELVTSLNSRLRTIATGEGAVFVDLYQALVSNIPTFVGSDGLHLTEVGYQRVAETFSTAIQTALEVR